MLTNYQNFFIVGIKGVAMANIARILLQMGKHVTGSDVDEEFITDTQLSNINILSSFDAALLPQDTEVVLYSAAHQGIHNPQMQEAQKRGLVVLHQAEFIGELLKLFDTSIAVAGCHGKTTTSALLSYALTKLGVKPSYLVGVSEFNHLLGGQFAGKDYFILEADEYAIDPPQDKTPKFHRFYPTHAIVMNIDFDHPDVYKDLDQTKEAFVTFLKQIVPPEDPKPHIVLCIDDKSTADVATTLVRDTYVTYGTSKEADVIVSDIVATEGGMSFKVVSSLLQINDIFTISLYGEKNVLNTVGVITLLRLLDFTLTQIQIAIDTFEGAKRRFELIFSHEDTYVFDDYAHHPQEIRATIQAARMRFPKKRVIVLFQPHTYTRTEALQEDFITALHEADLSLIAPVFGSARENAGKNKVSSKDLEAQARQRGISNIFGFSSKEELIASLPLHLKKGDVIFTMGAGDIYKLAPEIKKSISTQ